MKYQILIQTCLGLVMSSVMFGQVAGGKGGVPTTTTTAPLGGMSTTPGHGTTTQPTTTMPDLQRPLYLSGKVMLDDGTPPTDSVTLQLVCGGNPKSVGVTDSKGRFNVDLGNRMNSALYSDASESGFGRGTGNGMGSTSSRNLGSNSPAGGPTMSDRNLTGCDLRASLAGFRSDQVNLANRHSLDNPEIGTIVMHRLANVEGLTISATSALAPKDAKKAFEKGLNDVKKAKWENAQADFEKAVDVYPKYATAWYQLGFAQQQQNNIEGARKSYAQALAADPKLVTPYQQLSLLALKEGKWEEVATTTDRLVRLNPIDFPQAWYFNALAKYKLQQFDAAEKAAKEGLKADSEHRFPKMDQLMAVILAEKRDYPGAAQHLTAYLALAPDAPDSATVKQQLAELQKALAPQEATSKAPEK